MDDMFQGASQVTYRHMRDKVVIALQYFLGGPETSLDRGCPRVQSERTIILPWGRDGRDLA